MDSLEIPRMVGIEGPQTSMSIIPVCVCVWSRMRRWGGEIAFCERGGMGGGIKSCTHGGV